LGAIDDLFGRLLDIPGVSVWKAFDCLVSRVVRAPDIERARAIRNHGGIVDLVTEFVVEVIVAGCRVDGIDASAINDVHHSTSLADDRSRRARNSWLEQICDSHCQRVGRIGDLIAHAVASFLEAGASGKIGEVVLAKAVVGPQFAVTGKDHSQSDGGYQN
jgi:hypothetical protein